MARIIKRFNEDGNHSGYAVKDGDNIEEFPLWKFHNDLELAYRVAINWKNHLNKKESKYLNNT